MSDQKKFAGGMHLSEDQLRRYAAKLLAPEELLRVDAHVSDCLQCQAELTRKLGAIPDSLMEEFVPDHEEEHLGYEQMVHFMETKVSDRDPSVASHLKICKRCTRELNDLQSYAKEFQAEPVRKSSFRWVFAVAAVVASIAVGAALLFQIQETQQSRASKQVRAMVSIKEPGTNIILDEHGKLSGLEDASQNEHQMVIHALQSNTFETPSSLRELIGARGTLRGEPSPVSFRVLAPAGTFIQEVLPVFHWEALEGASKYKVTILDEEMNLIAESSWIQETSWKAETVLPRNHSYIWQVAALRNGVEVVSPQPPAALARFRILDQQSFERLKMESEKSRDSNLLLGLLYARYGVLDEAEKHLQLVSDANPQSKEIKQLLQKLKAIR